jgi:hypothetical protein
MSIDAQSNIHFQVGNAQHVGAIDRASPEQRLDSDQQL